MPFVILMSFFWLYFLYTESFSVLWLLELFLFPFVIFHNKIELNNNNLMIDSFLFIPSRMFLSLYTKKAISIFDISEITFAEGLISIPFQTSFLPGTCIKILYSKNGKKSKFLIPIYFFPKFKYIINDIIEKRPGIKINRVSLTIF